jgi:hypothetical protein
VTIAGNTTVNNGVPGEIFGTAASYTFQNGVTGQQTPVNIVVPLVTGWYELNVEVIQTSVGSSCSGAASFAIQWNWTDGDTGFSITGQNNVSLWAANSGGTLAANSTASVSITTLDASKIWTSVARKIWAQAGGQISYTLNVTSNSLTCSAYPSIEIRPLVVAY